MRPTTTPRIQRPRRRLRVALSALVAIGVVAGCAVGPDTGPPLIVDDGGGAGQTTSTPPPPPTLSAPRNDLAWRACPGDLAARFGLPAPAADVRLDCATFEASVTPGVATRDTVNVAAVRVRLTSTPASGAPLVVTSGTDMPSAVAGLLMADGPGRALLADHPLVAVDRRGTGSSGPLDCFTSQERSIVLANGLTPATRDVQARGDLLATTAGEAADACTETISPYQLAFTSANAAGDLEQLRRTWGVDRLGIVGVGAGADVALAYAGLYRDRVGRLILDTPTAYGASVRDRAQQVAAGTDAAIAGFSSDCASQGCPLGADPGAAIRALVQQGAQGRLGDITDTDVLAALSTGIALTTTDRASTITRVARLLAGGESPALTAAVDRARALRGTDGQLLSRCNDASSSIGRTDVTALQQAWQSRYPYTGTDTALSLLRCSGWPAGPAAPRPLGFDVPILVLTSGFDTINGGTGAGALTPLIITAGGRASTITYDGPGFSVTAHSDCAADIVNRYARSGDIPPSGACPS
ncbi:alpha/beta fold hydrolase [uncultured Williamsia sp.]|uniref:alpha/beta hydrolase n=1 Tax=uncultured Williamsia sp. TaxID=259311 RepID=UPI00260AAB3A|nr:alpha/beta fold hydrolase [uncultured Williamsia sp.]